MNHILPADHTEITGRDDFIIGLALSYALTVMRAAARHKGRAPRSDCYDVSCLLARYPEYKQQAMQLSAYVTATGEAPEGFEALFERT